MKTIFYIAEFFRPLLWIIGLSFKKVRDRRSYELSFKLDHLPEKFDCVFHISSEGELELAMPLIENRLNEKQMVHLIFTSDSVEKKVLKLKDNYSDYFSYSLFKIITFIPFYNSLSSLPLTDHFVMVRYDFFPQLLAYGKKYAKRRTLIAATMKNKENLSSFKELYFKWVFNHFETIICSRGQDIELIKNLAPNKEIIQFEFRVDQILKRLEQKDRLISLDWFSRFEKIIKAFPREKRIVLGSAWPEDLRILSHEEFREEIIKGEWFVLIAPHKLNSDFINQINNEVCSILNKKNVPLITEKSLAEENIIISEIPGVLCELYSWFGQAYVGGGFNASIHSVLEPFWSVEKIYSGPKNYRSPEIDMIREIDRDAVITLESPNEFYPKLIEDTHVQLDIRSQVANEQLKLKSKIIENLFERNT